ncbi:MAG: succinate dehydrogenase flavoprotein subunit [Bdellovibrio sp.]|nr:succinate dehydrogenase flavoprotein subunit [Bdellovibrio sp.]
MAKAHRLIVVGGGLAGLMTTIRACEAGMEVDLFSVVPVKRSHSVCAQGGINGAVNTKGEGDSPWEHFDDTVYGGDFLANQPPVQKMCEAAPGIIYLMDRLGVPFNRTHEGFLDFRRFGGTKHHRTAFAGASTGQQLLYALDEQVRRFEVEGKVRKFETWEYLGMIQDSEGRCCGIVATHIFTMEVKAFRGAAVALGTGGPGMVFGKSTNSIINTGAAAAVTYLQGVKYANGEFIQVHPTAIPGEDKLRLMSESARGEGGRVWVPKNGKPWYFLEEMYPAYGNLVPRDIATRAIHKVVYDLGLGVNGQSVVYLDLSHIPAETLRKKLGAILEIYEKFMGDDPTRVPMKVFPAVHYSMGGLWVDYDQMTSVPGLFAVGEVDYSIHGANRLGANSLLSCIYAGMVAGPAMAKWAKGLKTHEQDLPSSAFDEAVKQHSQKIDFVKKMDGPENPFVIGRELGDWMTRNVTVVRYNDKLKATDQKVQELQERWNKIGIQDRGNWTNQSVHYTRQLYSMLHLARVITIGALQRDESRGAHYKPDFPERNDEKFMKTTIATHKGPQGVSSERPFGKDQGHPQFAYEAIDVSLVKPRPRKYDVDKAGSTAHTTQAQTSQH